MYGWRAYATKDGGSFMRDEVQLYLAKGTSEALHTAELKVELGISVPAGTVFTGTVQPSVIPMELAEALFHALAPIMFGVDDLPAECERLTRALAISEARVDKLINGIGRLGEQDGN